MPELLTFTKLTNDSTPRQQNEGEAEPQQKRSSSSSSSVVSVASTTESQRETLRALNDDHERLLREARTWALVDHLAEKVVGELVVRHPELGARLDAWAVDGDFPRFAHYADALLSDTEFFVRKAIGWVLRDTARRRPELVFDWLLPRAARASGVTFREAVKPLSADQRVRLLAAR